MQARAMRRSSCFQAAGVEASPEVPSREAVAIVSNTLTLVIKFSHLIIGCFPWCTLRNLDRISGDEAHRVDKGFDDRSTPL